MYLEKIDKIHNEIWNNIKLQKPKSKGMENHLYGVNAEKIISELLLTKEGKDILDYMKLKRSEIVKIVYGKELSSYTNSNKIDILIITNTRKIGVSCKTSKCSVVGVLEMHGDTFYKKCKEFLKRSNMSCKESSLKFFPLYDDYGRTIKAVKKNDLNSFNEFCKNINQDWRKLLQFCIQGEDKEEKVEFLFFYDKEKHYLYVSNIEDYLDLIKKYGNPLTLNTRMSITSTSNKSKSKRKEDRRIKFKMQNPIYILRKHKII